VLAKTREVCLYFESKKQPSSKWSFFAAQSPFLVIRSESFLLKEANMRKRLLVLVLTFLLSMPFVAGAAYAAEEGPPQAAEEALHNQQGLAHFNKAFYDLLPHQKKEEAAREFGLAVQEFQKALALNPDFPQAHRNLARVYYLQKKYSQAAKHYERLTELNPSDIDSYVQAASAYAEAGNFAEARAQLEAAKTMTEDEHILKKLDGYLEKLDEKTN
jgi:tetratricopeptide (TPR) repeat protein